MEKSITIKNLDHDLFQKLKEEAKKQGKDVNALLVQLLANFFDIKPNRKKGSKKELKDLAGTWNKKEYREFMDNTADLRQIDEQLWK
ncbi:MAG: hypothetical protein SH857_13300 [Chitinophagales bacterium]|nr:hypothetical protein [Chitinophagales bacterium]